MNSEGSRFRDPEAQRRQGLRPDWKAFGILVLVLLLRTGFASLAFARPELTIANDTDRYVPIARAILAGTAYGWNTQRSGELLNTAGYPAFLAAVFGFIGPDPGDVALAQLMLSGLVALCLYLVLNRMVGVKPAFISAVLLALDPLTILWSLTILTETLFAALLGLAALMLALWGGTQDRRALIASAIFVGLSCLVKPFSLLIVVVWAAAVVLYPGSATTAGLSAWGRRVRPALLFVLPTILLVAPWFVRNAMLWNCPTLSSVDRVTMRDYVAAKILAEDSHISLGAAQAQLQATDPGPCPRRTGDYVRMILNHPQTYLRLHVAGTIPILIGTSFDRWLQFFGMDYTVPDLWQPFVDGGVGGVLQVLRGEAQRFPLGPALMIALTAYQLLIYALVVLGVLAFRAVHSPMNAWILLSMLAAILILVLTPGQGGHERFRVPAQPLFLIVACYGSAGKALPWATGLRRKSGVPRGTV